MDVTRMFAETFARDWIEAWNAHDLPRVLAHYTDDFAMHSPLTVKIAGEPSGKLQGKAQVAAHWRIALTRNPSLKFELLDTLVGASSVVVFYRTNFGRQSAGVFFFNNQGLVEHAAAHCRND